jgi:hypothetical protein
MACAEWPCGHDAHFGHRDHSDRSIVIGAQRREAGSVGPIESLEELSPAGPVQAHGAGVESAEQLGAAGVEGGSPGS